MEKDKYVAYVSTYTQGDKNGIKIYDVDMEKGRFIEKDKVEITNSSYVTISHNAKYLYSITDFGVESYRILKDGSLEFINFASNNGMRGCYHVWDWRPARCGRCPPAPPCPVSDRSGTPSHGPCPDAAHFS